MIIVKCQCCTCVNNTDSHIPWARFFLHRLRKMFQSGVLSNSIKSGIFDELIVRISTALKYVPSVTLCLLLPRKQLTGTPCITRFEFLVIIITVFRCGLIHAWCAITDCPRWWARSKPMNRIQHFIWCCQLMQYIPHGNTRVPKCSLNSLVTATPWKFCIQKAVLLCWVHLNWKLLDLSQNQNLLWRSLAHWKVHIIQLPCRLINPTLAPIPHCNNRWDNFFSSGKSSFSFFNLAYIY